MKISVSQADSFVSSPGKMAGVLIYGPDQGLVSGRARQIMSAIIGEDDNAFLRSEVTEEQILADPAQLSDALQSMSLLGGQQLIWLRDATDKSARAVQDASGTEIQNYLLVTAGELGPRSPLRAYFEKAATLAALPCYVDDKAATARLIRQRLTQAQMQADAQVIAYLSEKLGGDRLMVEAELTKLVLYASDSGVLTLEMAQRAIESEQTSSMDQVAHFLLSGQVALLMRQIDSLLMEAVQPIVMLRAIDRQLIRLEAIFRQIQSGMSAQQAIDAARPPIFFKDKPRFVNYINRLNASLLMRMRHQLLSLETSIKLQHETSETRFKHGVLRLCANIQLKAAA